MNFRKFINEIKISDTVEDEGLNIGDRVKYIGTGVGSIKSGYLGKYLGNYKYDRNYLAIDFDRDISGHNCSDIDNKNRARDGHGWYVRKKYLVGV
jgi:hypothetical protein